MLIQFQIIRDQNVIFEITSDEPDESRIAALTHHAMVEFQKSWPGLSLLDEVTLKWSKISDGPYGYRAEK